MGRVSVKKRDAGWSKNSVVVVELVEDRSSTFGTPVLVVRRGSVRFELRATLERGEEWTIGTRHRSEQTELGELFSSAYMRARNTAGSVRWYRVTYWETWVRAMRLPSRVEIVRAHLLERVKSDAPETNACLRALHALAYDELLPPTPVAS